MIRFFILGCTVLMVSGCATRPIQFQDAPPVESMNDDAPAAVPQAKEFNFREYAIASSARYPLVDALAVKSPVRSRDVNAMDEVVSSSWYTPRLVKEKTAASSWISGPEKTGAPQAPFKVLKVKKEGSAPGFILQDARGSKYLVKFDDARYPGLESGTNLVLNRLFGAMGYYVPEDYVLELSRADVSAAEGGKVTEAGIDEVFEEAQAKLDQKYPVTASLFLDGKILGSPSQRGRRKDDFNDRVNHENLRAVRAMRVFSAWLGNNSFRSDNWLDVYVGEPGQGHVKHYLLDFGESFGLHGTNYGHPWEGYEYFFSWGETAKEYAGLGLRLKDFQKENYDEGDPLAFFMSDVFDPREWKSVFQYTPFRNALPDDDYWAAKLIAQITEQDWKTLFAAAPVISAENADRLIRNIMVRREKVLRHYFSQVTPLEASLQGSGLQLEDQAVKFLEAPGQSRYLISYQNSRGKNLMKPEEKSAGESSWNLEIPANVISASGGYLRVVIHKQASDGRWITRPAQFHLKTDASGQTRLIGVIH